MGCAFFDRFDKIDGGFFTHALETGELFGPQRINIRNRVDQPLLDQLLDKFLTQAVDVHRLARGEMFDRFGALRLAIQTSAATRDGLAFELFDI